MDASRAVALMGRALLSVSIAAGATADVSAKHTRCFDDLLPGRSHRGVTPYYINIPRRWYVDGLGFEESSSTHICMQNIYVDIIYTQKKKKEKSREPKKKRAHREREKKTATSVF